MATPKRNPTGPFAVSMDLEFIDRLGEPVRAGKAKSVSEIVRAALEHYDFSDVMFLKPAQIMISVRLPTEVRQNLRKLARAKQTSVSQLVRAAVEAYLPQLESDLISPTMPEAVAAETPPDVVPMTEPTPAAPVVPAEVPLPVAKKRVGKKSLAKRRSVPKTQRKPERRRKTPARKKSR